MTEVHREPKVQSPISKVETETPVPLSVAEMAALLECKEIIRQGQEAFVRVGRALARIRDSRLYRDKYPTFEAFCAAELDMSDRYARGLRTAADVVGLLEQAKFSTLPATESQARPVAKLPREEWSPAWEEVVGTAPHGKVTARHVDAVVERRLERLGPLQSKVQNPKSKVEIVEGGTRAEQIRARAAAAQAELRALQDLIGTADGSVTANVATAVYHIDALRDHLARVEKMQSNRKAAS
jgi:hypothetical protein